MLCTKKGLFNTEKTLRVHPSRSWIVRIYKHNNKCSKECRIKGWNNKLWTTNILIQMPGKGQLGRKRSIKQVIIVITKLKVPKKEDTPSHKRMKSLELVKKFWLIQCLKVKRIILSRPRKFHKPFTPQRWVRWSRWNQAMLETVDKIWDSNKMAKTLVPLITELLVQISLQIRSMLEALWVTVKLIPKQMKLKIHLQKLIMRWVDHLIPESEFTKSSRGIWRHKFLQVKSTLRRLLVLIPRLALFKEEKTLISHNFKMDESVAKGRLEVALLNQDSRKLLMGIQLILQTMIVLSERAKLVEECLHSQRKNQQRSEIMTAEI